MPPGMARRYQGTVSARCRRAWPGATTALWAHDAAGHGPALPRHCGRTMPPGMARRCHGTVGARCRRAWRGAATALWAHDAAGHGPALPR